MMERLTNIDWPSFLAGALATYVAISVFVMDRRTRRLERHVDTLTKTISNAVRRRD
jgi:hypothetical protein